MAEVWDVQQLKLTWETRRNAPYGMSMGAAVAHGSVGYFYSNYNHGVFAYDSEKDDWSQLPECPQRDFGLAVINNLPTAVGGKTSGLSSVGYTNQLVSFSRRTRKWKTIFPPMPTKRRWLAVTSAQNYLIAAGGEGRRGRGRIPVHSGGDEYYHSRVVHCSQPTRICLRHVGHCLWRASLPPGT